MLAKRLVPNAAAHESASKSRGQKKHLCFSKVNSNFNIFTVLSNSQFLV